MRDEDRGALASQEELLVVLPQVLTVFHEYEHLAIGLIMIAVMIFMRAGVVPSLAGLFARRPA